MQRSINRIIFEMNRALTEPNYASVHYWLTRTFGKADHCEHCDKPKKKFHWALKQGMIYERKRENFLQLCVSCHIKYDQTPERRKLNAEAQRVTDKSYCYKAVAIIDEYGRTIRSFTSIRGAAKELGISHTAICLTLRGTTHTAGGFKWRYVNLSSMTPVRKECHTRCTFAYEQGEKWFKKITYVVQSGNIFSSKATLKFLQARKIYIHYQNEYQKAQELPLSV